MAALLFLALGVLFRLFSLLFLVLGVLFRLFSLLFLALGVLFRLFSLLPIPQYLTRAATWHHVPREEIHKGSFVEKATEGFTRAMDKNRDAWAKNKKYPQDQIVTTVKLWGRDGERSSETRAQKRPSWKNFVRKSFEATNLSGPKGKEEALGSDAGGKGSHQARRPGTRRPGTRRPQGPGTGKPGMEGWVQHCLLRKHSGELGQRSHSEHANYPSRTQALLPATLVEREKSLGRKLKSPMNHSPAPTYKFGC